jgi:hypothetical protein
MLLFVEIQKCAMADAISATNGSGKVAYARDRRGLATILWRCQFAGGRRALLDLQN